MSDDNFDDAMHIVKKINFFLGMCLQDVDHLNYDDDAKKILRYLLNQHGNIFLNHLVEAVIVTDKISTIKKTKEIVELSDEDAKEIQDEWNKGFNGKTKRPKLETRNLFSEGQEGKEYAQESTGDPRASEMEEGGLGKGPQP